MPVVTSQADFATLTDLRMAEAKALFGQGLWDAAYYLSGYAVEFALKVRIIRELMTSNAFPDKRAVDDFHKHNLTVLRSAAGLEDEMKDDPAVSLHWFIVKDWSEQTRYQTGRTEQAARDLINAIENGVLPWIKARW